MFGVVGTFVPEVFLYVGAAFFNGGRRKREQFPQLGAYKEVVKHVRSI